MSFRTKKTILTGLGIVFLLSWLLHIYFYYFHFQNLAPVTPNAAAGQIYRVNNHGGTLVIDDFGRQRVAARDLLNRWIMPLERRVDFLTLNSGKKIEVPFEQLVIFSTNIEDKELVDEAFLRRMGYRARVEPPSCDAYAEIFRRAASRRGLSLDPVCLDYVLRRYASEARLMKSCEPRDLINRVSDICIFQGSEPRLTTELLDLAWRNYFGTSHGFGADVTDVVLPARAASIAN